MSLLRAITTIGGLTLISRVLGFVRDILIAAVLGTGMAADAFFVAFRFPNLFRRLFAEGAFSAAFIPIFSTKLNADNNHDARQFAEQAFSVLALVLVVFVGVVELSMPWLVDSILAPGFADVDGKSELATVLSRIAFPYLFFISLVSLLSGVLNALGKFAAAAATPILLNIVLIFALLVLTPIMPTPGHALSIGVFTAGVLQLLWLGYYVKKAGFPVRLVRPRLTPSVRLLGARILPVVFGASLYQINLLIGTILASLLAEGAVSYLYYADRVTQLPLGIVGVAVGTALLPMLSKQLQSGDEAAALNSQNRGIEFAFLLTLPAAVALVVIASPVISVLFERGAFGTMATTATANALMAFAVGLPAFVLIKVLAPGFFSRGDTKTPVKIAAVSMVLNIVLNLILMRIWGHVGIAVASSAAAWVNAGLLAFVLWKRRQLVADPRLRSRFVKTFLASVVMALMLLGLQNVLVVALAGAGWLKILALAGLIVAGLMTYAVMAVGMGAVKLDDLKRFIKK